MMALHKMHWLADDLAPASSRLYGKVSCLSTTTPAVAVGYMGVLCPPVTVLFGGTRYSVDDSLLS